MPKYVGELPPGAGVGCVASLNNQIGNWPIKFHEQAALDVVMQLYLEGLVDSRTIWIRIQQVDIDSREKKAQPFYKPMLERSEMLGLEI